VSQTPKDEGDNAELMVRRDLRATPGIQELMDPTVPEVYKVRSDLPDHQDHKVLQDLKAQKAQLVGLPEPRAITQKEDRPLRKKLRLQISQSSMGLRRPLEPGCLKEIIGIATVRPGDGENL